MNLMKRWQLIASVACLCCLCLLEYFFFKNSADEIAKNMATDSIGAILIYIVVGHVLPKENPNLAATNSINEKLDALIGSEQNRYDAVTRLLKLSRSIIGNQQLVDQLHKIARSKDASRECYQTLEVFFDDVIIDKVREIEEASRGFIKYNEESDRINAIRKLFDNLRLLPNIGKLYAVSWDYDDYFYRYWGRLSLDQEYLQRNANVASDNIKIERLFIFDENNFGNNKRNIFNQIYDTTNRIDGIETKWIFENDITNERIRNKQSSFLLVETKNNELIIATQSEGPGNKTGEMYLAFNNSGVSKELYERFKLLWHIKDRERPSLIQE